MRWSTLLSPPRGPRIRPCAVGLVTLLSACGQTQQSERPSSLIVFAAASLTETFESLKRGFERENPTVTVRLVLAGSQVLRLQIENGAAADVFASADETHMQALVRAGYANPSQTFAINALTVIVPNRNPAGIERFSQLDRAKKIVMGNEHVPAGRYARTVLSRAADRFGQTYVDRIRNRVVSEENSVRLVRAKVELGEADAAFVYRTDAISATEVRIVAIPPDVNVEARYPIASLARAPQPDIATRFVEYVRSTEGRRTLIQHGFRPVPE